MKPNVGKTDRLLRLLLGVVILVIGYIYQSWWGLIGILPIASAIFARCPLYSVLGASTVPVKKEEPKAVV